MLYIYRDLVSLFKDFLNYIEFLVMSIFNFAVYLFEHYIKGKHFVGFLLLHPIVLFWLDDEIPFLMFFASVLAFLLYYRLFLIFSPKKFDSNHLKHISLTTVV